MSDRKIALVVGSGSVKCAAALGLWKVLHRYGIQIDYQLRLPSMPVAA